MPGLDAWPLEGKKYFFALADISSVELHVHLFDIIAF